MSGMDSQLLMQLRSGTSGEARHLLHGAITRRRRRVRRIGLNNVLTQIVCRDKINAGWKDDYIIVFERDQAERRGYTDDHLKNDTITSK